MVSFEQKSLKLRMYVYVKGEYQSALQEIKHYVGHESKLNEYKYYHIVRH